MLFQALLDATYVLECMLVNEDFPQDKSEKEIKHLIGNSNGYFTNLLIFFLRVFFQSITLVVNLRSEYECEFE